MMLGKRSLRHPVRPVWEQAQEAEEAVVEVLQGIEKIILRT